MNANHLFIKYFGFYRYHEYLLINYCILQNIFVDTNFGGIEDSGRDKSWLGTKIINT